MFVLLLLVTISTLAFAIFKYLKTKSLLDSSYSRIESLRQEFETLKILNESFRSENSKLSNDISGLKKYVEIADIENHIRLIKSQAEAEINDLKSKANIFISNERKAIQLESEKSKSICEELLKSSKENIKALQSSAESAVAAANQSAKRIIEIANIEARKIAADAIDAKGKAEDFKQTAIAMKNIIDGYGDRYLIPTSSLIDELAEDYSHTDAGIDLKRAKDNTRSMIKNRAAASCEYVETNRRDTAINFVLDAFNGKVDSILSNVKKDNFGTLEQRIRDAFETVNHNGRAFREARITELYLASRLDELKWACTVQALKEKEKEEQRQIREQIREEEKAARDYEKAIREAQKEEETLAKAMDKIRKDLESANEQQRINYEEKLRDLDLKLKEAEERNKRAISMAQQTKTGHVYVISNIGSFGDDIIKIGLTRRLDPQDRVDELGDASVPFDFDVHAMIMSHDAPSLEKELHRRFSHTQVNRVNPRKEFFNLKISDLKKVLDEMGIQTHWTMTAEAKEHRESLAIAKRKGAEAA